MTDTEFLVFGLLVTCLLPALGLSWLLIRWGRRVTASPNRPIARWVWTWLIVGPLVPLGAYLMIGHFVMTSGWTMTIWVFGMSALQGLLQRDA